MSFHIKFSRYLSISLLIIIMFFVCQYTLIGVGAGSSERNALLFLLFVIILSFSAFSFWFLVFSIFIFMALYIPIGLVFGLPTYQSIASVISTNILETKEFFEQISIYNFTYSIVLILFFLLFRFCYVRNHITLHKSKFLLIVFVCFSFFNPNTNLFYSTLYHSYLELKKTGVELSSYKDNWQAVSLNNSGYDRYIVIIGESARVDYINSFGYPLKNTPFMSSHGLSVKGLISGGSNTVASLSNMLTRNIEGDPDYTKNIIDLANDAGFDTYWLSNQGFISDVDTPLSMIANLSKNKKFIKYGAFNSKNTSDFMLVDLFKNVIDSPIKKKELIIVHLYGSHPKPCHRVADFNGSFYSDDPNMSNIACYVNSIEKTDKVLSDLYNILNDAYHESGTTFSMVYFSDHGLVHDTSEKKINLIHGESIHSYSIPLFKVSSDDSNYKLCHSKKSGLKMIDGLSHWAVIKNANLDSNYSLFDCQDDSMVDSYINKLEKNFHPDQDAITTLLERK